MAADTVQREAHAGLSRTTVPEPSAAPPRERLTKWRIQLHTFATSIEKEIDEVLAQLAALGNSSDDAGFVDAAQQQQETLSPDLDQSETISHGPPAACEVDLDEIDLPSAQPRTEGESDPNRLTALKIRLSQQMASTEQGQQSGQPELSTERED